MSYLVLARKYRPSTFAEVVGQEHVTRTLANAFATGRVHHAFLFCGPRGCGKTTLARIVGKALNCETRAANPGAGPEPCGHCTACVSINDGSAVDYREMDGASNRGIDAIRELTEAVRYQPAVLRKKVYVIDEVHMLTTEAFNALLKTLEEPPPHVTFVLATTEPHKLPNTILSRCQRYDFKLVPASRLAQHLTGIFAKEQLAIEPGAVSLVVRESGGSVRDALSLCDQLISYVGEATMTEKHVAEVLGVADRALTRTLVRALAEGDAGAALAAVEAAIERGVDEVQIARAIVRYLRDLSVLQVAAGRKGLVDATDEELAELAAEAGQLARSRVSQMFERMLRCCDELGKTLQPRLILDCALIDVATVEPLVPLGDLIERLSELEGRLAGRGPRAAAGAGGGGGNKPRPSPQAPSAPVAPRTQPRSVAPEPPAAAPSTASRTASEPLPAAGSSSSRGVAEASLPAQSLGRGGAEAPLSSTSQSVSESLPSGRGAAEASPAAPSLGRVGGESPGASSNRSVVEASSSSRSVVEALPSGRGVAEASPAAPSLGRVGGESPGASSNRSVVEASSSSRTAAVAPSPSSRSTGEVPPAAPRSRSTTAEPPVQRSATAAQPRANAADPSAAASSANPASPASSDDEPPHYADAVPHAVEAYASAPASMQPSGPIPKLETVAAGSGPHEPNGHAAPAAASAPAASRSASNGHAPAASAPPHAAAASAQPKRLTIPANPAEALAAWDRVLSELETLRKLSLLGPFSHARVMTWTPQLLELGYPVDMHSMGDLAKDSVDDLRAVIRSMSPELANVKVAIRLLDPRESQAAGARSVLETTHERTSAERNKREAEAREHPITKHVLQTFGAQIKEIKTDV